MSITCYSVSAILCEHEKLVQMAFPIHINKGMSSNLLSKEMGCIAITLRGICGSFVSHAKYFWYINHVTCYSFGFTGGTYSLTNSLSIISLQHACDYLYDTLLSLTVNCQIFTEHTFVVVQFKTLFSAENPVEALLIDVVSIYVYWE